MPYHCGEAASCAVLSIVAAVLVCLHKAHCAFVLQDKEYTLVDSIKTHTRGTSVNICNTCGKKGRLNIVLYMFYAKGHCNFRGEIKDVHKFKILET